jgi:hypothetical protein
MRADTLVGGVPDSLDILADVADNNSASTFRLTLTRSTDIDAIDQDSGEPVDIINETGQTGDEFKVASNVRVMVDANFQGFYNYPNPFGTPERAETTFNYYLPQASDIEFRIYTLLGELVYAKSYKATDLQGTQGHHARDIVWDGKNGDGDPVLNGVYIAVLKANAGSVTTKVAVMK